MTDAEGAAPPQQAKPRDYIYGLDTIRLICAAVVAIGHHYTVIAPFGSPGLDRLVNFLFGLMWNGPAAVIVFFVISGFVIHYPYHQGKAFKAGEFYVKRAIRIVLPCIAFMLIYSALDGRPVWAIDWNATVLWSLICELIYYAIYPLIMRLRAPIVPLLIGTSLVWAGMIAVNLDMLTADRTYLVFGLWTFVAGYPCWLLGCWLAENLHRFRLIGWWPLMAWRVAAFGLPMLLQIVCNQIPAAGPFRSYVFLLNLYAPFCALWLGYELRAFAARGRPLLSDRWGQATFSLYLIHTPILIQWPLERTALSLAIYGAACVAASWLFFILCERPSHRLARKLGDRLR